MAKAARSSATMSSPSGSTVAIWGSVPDTCGRKTMGSPPAASPLHTSAAATSTTMAEGTFGKKRFRRYMPAMQRADTTAQAHEAPGRHETMATTFDTMAPEVSAVVPRSSGTWPMTTVSAMPKMNPCMTGSGIRRIRRPAPAQPSSSRNSGNTIRFFIVRSFLGFRIGCRVLSAMLRPRRRRASASRRAANPCRRPPAACR